MKVHLSYEGDLLHVQYRAEGDKAVGDAHVVLKPGEKVGAWSYAKLSKLGPGEHDIDAEE